MLTVKGGAGNDTINRGTNSSGILYQYDAGDGYDTILGFNGDDTLQITGAEYSTSISGNDVIVSVGTGAIALKNAASLDSIYIWDGESGGGEGSGEDNVDHIIYGTAGNDSIINAEDGYTILAAGGNDTIRNSGNSVVVDAGDGSDLVFNAAATEENVTINGGAGNDSVNNAGSNAIILGGAGADSIVNSGDNVTISGDGGNDIIRNTLEDSANVYQYTAGDGNDTIYGFSVNDTLDITGSGISSSVVSGENLIFKVGKGSITLAELEYETEYTLNVKGKTSTFVLPSEWSGTKNADEYFNERDNFTVRGLAGNDTLDNTGTEVLIDGGDGNDELTNFDGDLSTIIGGKGNDTIFNDFAESSNVYQYASGDGKDVIYGFSEYDELHITSGSITSTVTSGADIIIKVGKGAVTLKDMAGYELIVDDNIITAGALLDEISAFSADNSAVGNISTSNFKNLAQAENQTPILASGK